jgi:hypothetical protein
MARRKKPGKALSPDEGKKPRADSSLKSSANENPVWHIGLLDTSGPWGWNKVEKAFFFSEIFPKIKNFETMVWSEILNRNNHEVLVSQISKKAQKRLEEIKLDDVDQLVSLRLMGEQRLWGIKVSNILKILWWDPNHEVYPSKLKHT